MLRFRFHAVLAFVCLASAAGPVNAQTRASLRKPAYARLETALAELARATAAGQPLDAAVATLQNPLAAVGAVPVSIKTTSADAIAALVRAEGGRIANQRDGVVEAYVTPAILRSLNAAPAVRRVTQIRPPVEQAVSQGVFAHNAANWHDNSRTGTGVKVGIIDSFLGMSMLVGTELPASVTARCYTSIGVFSSTLTDCESRSNHGTAVAESLVDIAPGVELYIANPLSPLDMRNSVDWMTSQGVRVINHSLAWFWDGPGDGTSPYSDSPLATADAAVAGGALFVTAAGNVHRSTYLGAFSDTNGDGWAEFAAGNNDNYIVLNAGQTVALQLRWEDSWTAANRDLDLALYDSAGQFLAASANSQEGISGDVPFEILAYTVPVSGVYIIGVHRFAGAEPGWIQLQEYAQKPLGVTTAGGSIMNPAESANPGVLAVGAAAWNTPFTIEPFSARGPTPDGRVKPDIVGADRGATVTYGPTGFAGTSQATPHVAGLAALVLQLFPAYSPSDVATYLKTNAATRGAPDPNNTWGEGFATLPLSCSYSLSSSSAAARRFGGTGAVSVLTQFACPWTAQSLTPGVSILGGAAGSNDGTVTYSVAPNGGVAARTLTLRIAGMTFSILQMGSVVPTLDLNGDGWLDLLWHHQGDGRIAGWLMNGYNLMDGTLLTPSQVPDTNWKLQGAGDLDGDGKIDLVWQNIADGRVSAWLMNGLVQRQGTLFSIPQVPDTQWRIRSVGDLNGDRRADLFWQHEGTGDIAVWLMNGLTVVDGTLLNPSQVADLNWKIVGTADFDRNGSRDLVWHHQGDGRVAIWFMNGTSLMSGSPTNPGEVADLNWKIRAVGDLNGDGHPDFLWQNVADGRISVWLMQGLNLIDGTLLNPSEVSDTDWHVVGPR